MYLSLFESYSAKDQLCRRIEFEFEFELIQIIAGNGPIGICNWENLFKVIFLKLF